MNSKPTPLLIISDAPEMQGGLSRICRDVAANISQSPLYRVATLSRGCRGSRKLPWQQYTIREHIPGNAWGEADLPWVWQDFAGRERGVVMTIYDPTRCLGFTLPDYCAFPETSEFMRGDHFDLWGYVTLDSTGPGDRLSALPANVLLGYHRLLAYTKWGEGAIRRSIGDVAADARRLTWLPHGIELDRWPLCIKETAQARMHPFLHEGERLVGVVATNQPRKDWGLAASACREIMLQDKTVKFWWHVDLDQRHWSIPALLADFGLGGRTQVTANLSHDDLCWRLNACDLTLHPGLGEGFGYPIFESLACGSPALHGDYAGGADVLRQCGWEKWLIRPENYRVEGLHNQIRPVFDPMDWADRALAVLSETHDRDALRASVAHLDWKTLWPSCWLPWFQEGLK